MEQAGLLFSACFINGPPTKQSDKKNTIKKINYQIHLQETCLRFWSQQSLLNKTMKSNITWSHDAENQRIHEF